MIQFCFQRTCLFDCLCPSLYGAVAIQGIAVGFVGILFADGGNDVYSLGLQAHIGAKGKIGAFACIPCDEQELDISYCLE